MQRYRLQRGAPTQAFREYFEELDSAIDTILTPALSKAGLLLSPERYEKAGLEGSMRLASIPDFNTLIANSQQARKPVFSLTQEDVRRSGYVWDKQKENIDAFRVIFEELATKIESNRTNPLRS